MKTMANSVSEVCRFKDAPKLKFLLWLLGEIKTLSGECDEEKEQKSFFYFPKPLSVWLCRFTHLLLHSSTRAGLLVPGFNETDYCHSHIWA